MRASDPSARANSAFCWLPPGKRQDRVAHVGRADLDALLPLRREFVLRVLRDQQSPAQAPERPHSDVLGDRPERKDAVALPVAGHQRHGLGDFGLRGLVSDRIEHGEEQIRLPVARETRKADHLALSGHEFAPVRLPLRADPHTDRCARRWRGRDRCRIGMRFGAAHRRDELVAIESLGRAARDDAAVAHHDDAVGGAENLAEQVRDQDAARARRDGAAEKAEQLPRGMAVERGGRLVEDDEAQRIGRDREGAGDLDHLPLADRQDR